MKDPKALLRRYFADYFRWLVEVVLVFGGALLIWLLPPETSPEFVWVVPVGLFIVFLTNLSPLILLFKAMGDRRGQRVVRQRIFIKTVCLDPGQNMKSRFGAILGKAKYQLVDESGGVYRLCAALKRSRLIHPSPETEADVEYLERSRLVVSIRLVPDGCKRLPNNSVALLEFSRFFADYIRQ